MQDLTHFALPYIFRECMRITPLTSLANACGCSEIMMGDTRRFSTFGALEFPEFRVYAQQPQHICAKFKVALVIITNVLCSAQKVASRGPRLERFRAANLISAYFHNCATASLGVVIYGGWGKFLTLRFASRCTRAPLRYINIFV
jgi:hypothetical protein